MGGAAGLSGGDGIRAREALGGLAWLCCRREDTRAASIGDAMTEERVGDGRPRLIPQDGGGCLVSQVFEPPPGLPARKRPRIRVVSFKRI